MVSRGCFSILGFPGKQKYLDQKDLFLLWSEKLAFPSVFIPRHSPAEGNEELRRDMSRLYSSIDWRLKLGRKYNALAFGRNLKSNYQ